MINTISEYCFINHSGQYMITDRYNLIMPNIGRLISMAHILFHNYNQYNLYK